VERVTSPTYCIYDVFVKKIVLGKGVLEILEKKAEKSRVAHQSGCHPSKGFQPKSIFFSFLTLLQSLEPYQ